eukprot:130892-Chlamydomonas_euryale.AAC.4
MGWALSPGTKRMESHHRHEVGSTGAIDKRANARPAARLAAPRSSHPRQHARGVSAPPPSFARRHSPARRERSRLAAGRLALVWSRLGPVGVGDRVLSARSADRQAGRGRSPAQGAEPGRGAPRARDAACCCAAAHSSLQQRAAVPSAARQRDDGHAPANGGPRPGARTAKASSRHVRAEGAHAVSGSGDGGQQVQPLGHPAGGHRGGVQAVCGAVGASEGSARRRGTVACNCLPNSSV